MSSLPKNEFEAALRILREHYRSLMIEAAEDIVRSREEFSQGSFSKADEVIEKHYCRISRLAGVYSNLRSFASTELPKGSQSLSVNEFRCFGCGHVIRSPERQCALCGWTWM